MSDHDVQLLVIGICIGVYTMLAIQIIQGVIDDRRDRKAARAAQALLTEAKRRADEPDFVDTYANPAIIGKAGRP